MRCPGVFGFVAVVVCLPVAAVGLEVATPVSPGTEAQSTIVDERCPTFSWAGRRGAVAYEIAVYEVEVGAGDARPALAIRVDGGALSWTPPLADCLQRGGKYAWTIRAIASEGQSAWSRPSLFEVAAGPTRLEFDEALAVVRRYLEKEADSDGGPVTSESESDTPSELTAGARGEVVAQSAALDGADFSIDATGNVAGRSFAGDGSGLTGVDAATLGGHSLGAMATEAELSAHAADAAAHHDPTDDTTCDGKPCDGSLFTSVDAALLDGLDSTAFMPAGTDLWVDAGGDVMTGQLTISTPGGTALDADGDINLGYGALRKWGTLFLHGGVQKNTAVGYDASPAITTGERNTAVGEETLLAVTGGSDNTAVGWRALSANVMASWNTAVGSEALRSATDAFANTGVGHSALGATTEGDANTALGTGAMLSNTTGERNTAAGLQALSQSVDGSDNIAVGYQAGLDLASGSNNIFIGNRGADESGTIRLGSDQTATYIAGIHGTAVTGVPVAVTSSGQLGTASFGSGSGLDADTLDALESEQFLRSDAAASYGGGLLIVNPGSTLDVDGTLDASGAGVSLPTSGISGAGHGSGLDADTLDGSEATAFMPAGTDLWVDAGGDVMTGQLTISTPGGTALDADGDINLGYGALRKFGSLFLHEEGTNNTGVGNDALAAVTSGTDNTAVGEGALLHATEGNQNTAVGAWALVENTTGSANTAVGKWSLKETTIGFHNTALGYQSMLQNTDGNNNTAVGFASLPTNSTGGWNVAIGESSLTGSSSGSFNVGVGASTLYENALGSYNTAIGDRAGRYAAGDHNIFVGAGTGPPASAAVSHRLYLGGSPPLLYGQLDSPRRLAIDATDPTATLDVNGTVRVRGWSGSGDKAVCRDGDGVLMPCAGGIVLPTGSAGQTLRHDGTAWVADGLLHNSGARIGVGTTVPEEELHVKGSAVQLLLEDAASGPERHLAQIAMSGGTLSLAANHAAGAPLLGMAFLVRNGGLPLEAQTITGDGKVGIGVTSPSERLDVGGTVKASGFIGDGSGLGGVQKAYARTVVVSPAGSPAASGTALVAALGAITGAAAANPYLVKLEPGVYDLGTGSLVMKSWVDLEGSGEGVTTITATGGASCAPTAVTGTVHAAADAELRWLTVEAVGGECPTGIVFDAVSPRVTHVTAKGRDASGSLALGTGALTRNGAAPVLRDAMLIGTGARWGLGLSVDTCSASGPVPTLVRSRAEGVSAESVSGGQGGMGVNLRECGITIRDSELRSAGGYTGGALFSDTDCSSCGPFLARVESSVLEHSATALHADDSFTIRVAGSRFEGGSATVGSSGTATCAGVWDESFAFYASTCP